MVVSVEIPVKYEKTMNGYNCSGNTFFFYKNMKRSVSIRSVRKFSFSKYRNYPTLGKCEKDLLFVDMYIV